MKEIESKKVFVKCIQLPKKTVFLVAIVCFLIIGIGYTGKAIEVFTPERHLPIYSVETGNNKVAVTFDCAWGAEDIPSILDTLQKGNVKATFFIVGQWAEKYPDAVKLIAQAGHDIANHGYSHLRMSTINRERCKSEIELCNKRLEEISGIKVFLFRPPYGDYNNTVVDTCNELSCYPIQWDVDTLHI